MQQLATQFVMVADEGISLPKHKGQYHPFLSQEHNQVPAGIFMTANGTGLLQDR